MPSNIEQFNAGAGKLQPSETGVEALARAGRIEKENYDQAGRTYGGVLDQAGQQLTKYETMSEISQGSAALAVMHNNLSAQWNNQAVSANPNDNTIQQKFMDGANEQIEQWKNSFDTERGQQWAENQAASMQSHFWDKTSADMSSRAGSAIINNLKTTLSNLSEAAKNDPTTIDQALAHVDALTEAQKEHSQGLLTIEQSDKLNTIAADMKNEIVKSGVQGLADKNPEAAKQLINSGHFNNYMNGIEADHLSKYADGVTRMKQEDQNREREQQKRAQEDRNEQASTQVINSLFNQQTGQLAVPQNISQQIWQMSGVDGKTKMALLGAVKHMSQEDNMDDPNLVREFAARMTSTSNNPLSQDDLLGAMSAGKLTPATFNFFNGKLDDSPDGKSSRQQIAQAMRDAEDKIANTLYSSGTLQIPADTTKQIMNMPGIGGKEKMELINKVQTLNNKTAREENQDTISDFADRLKSDAKNPLTQDNLSQALKDQKISTSTYNFFNTKLAGEASGKISDDPTVFKQFSARLKPDTQQPLTKNDLLDAMAAGQITKTTYNFFNTQLQNTNYTPKSSGPGVLSSAYQRFQSWFIPAYQTASSHPDLNGLSEAQKAQALLNPDSKQNILGEKTMQQFKPTGDDLIKDAIPKVNASQLSPNVPLQPKAAGSTVPPPPAPGSPERAAWVKAQLNGF